MTTAPLLVGVDIGGTKVAAATVTAGGVIRRRQVRPTPRSGAAAVLQVVAELISSLELDGRADAIGVAAPGVVDARTGTVLSATDVLPGWAGAEVGTDLRKLVGRPVAVDNDVRTMALGELHDGAGAGARDALFVSVGTGIGGALALDGRLRHGSAWVAGELAHLLVPDAGGVACGCGRTDHLESVASGPAIARAYACATGRELALPAIVARMHGGDRLARDAVIGAATVLGRALAGLASALDVQRVVVGGGVATIGAAYLQPLAAALRAEVLPPLQRIEVAAAALGTDAPLLGAARLAAAALHAVPA